MSGVNGSLMHTPLAGVAIAVAKEGEAGKSPVAQKPPNAASPAKPAAHARPSLIERMRTEIVPLDELLAAKADLEAAAKADEDRYQAEREEAARFLQELRELRAQFKPILAQRRRRQSGDASEAVVRDAVIAQLEQRKAVIAQRLGEDTMSAFDAFDALMAEIDNGTHFGNFGYVLRGAEQAGFLTLIDNERAKAEVERGRKHLVFSFGGRKYFPVRFDHWRLSRTLAWEIKRLYSRALDHADAERRTQLALLESGKLPEAATLLKALDGGRSFKKPATFGVVVVDLPIRDKRTQRLFRFNGVVSIVIFDQYGKRYIGIRGVNGSAEQVLPLRSAPVSKISSETSPWAYALVRHLRNIAEGVSSMGDAKAEKRNATCRSSGRVEDLQPEGDAKANPPISGAEARAYRYEELRGTHWLARNSRWLERQREKGKIVPSTVAEQPLPPIEAPSAERVASQLVEAVFRQS